MAKAASKSKKVVAKSKPSASSRTKAAFAGSARKALAKHPAKPAAKVSANAAKKTKTTAKQAALPVKSGKWVYTFGDGKAEGKAGLKELLGGKGANLAEMANLGLPVPPGFTIPTSVCTYFYAHDKSYPKELKPQVEKALEHVAKITGKVFGDAKNPLLVSVRSGARASMPGMMDTVLNLGLNDKTVEALAALSGDRRFAYDSYRRFITMYSDVVLGFEHHHFEEILESEKARRGHELDTELSAAEWKHVIALYK
ncbi:MAG: PEP/pyruvate-binding domain-containing protein, partial [Nitrobacter sp.]